MDFKEQSIKTSIVACIIDDQKRVLLTRRCIEPFCGQWVMPGGKVDHGEPLAEALHREVREEVGLEVISTVCLMYTNTLPSVTTTITT